MSKATAPFPLQFSLPSAMTKNNVPDGSHVLSLSLCVITEEHMVSPVGYDRTVARIRKKLLLL